GRGRRSRAPSTGRGQRGRGNPRPASTFAPPRFEPTEEDADQWDTLNEISSTEYDTAKWTEENTQIFCDLVVEQIKQGNCPNGQMKPSAYKIMAQKYFEQTNLWHQQKQMKNRYSQCKSMYRFIKWANGEIGLGRGPNGEIKASPAWWKTHCTKQYWECKKFRHGWPTYLDQLMFMFHGIAVDGRSSYVPGCDDDTTDLNSDGEGDEEDDDLRSPISSSSLKRASSTTDTATSPPKKHKSPMVKYMKDMIDTLRVGSSKDLEVAKQIQDHIASKKRDAKLAAKEERDAEIEKCLQLVKECGASEDSEEFYVATMKFAESYNRSVFLNIGSPAARMAWLKRCCRDWSG
ncbi:hypothetical protein BS78_03G111000, partial [Paspalum vaginatum]